VKPYLDLYRLSEDERIELIRRACTPGKKVGVTLDNEPEKVARYVRKLAEYGVVELKCADGPVPNVITIVFGVKPS
jgi:hypothetical protein